MQWESLWKRLENGSVSADLFSFTLILALLLSCSQFCEMNSKLMTVNYFESVAGATDTCWGFHWRLPKPSFREAGQGWRAEDRGQVDVAKKWQEGMWDSHILQTSKKTLCHQPGTQWDIFNTCNRHFSTAEILACVLWKGNIKNNHIPFMWPSFLVFLLWMLKNYWTKELKPAHVHIEHHQSS